MISLESNTVKVNCLPVGWTKTIRKADAVKTCTEHGEYRPYVSQVSGRDIESPCPACRRRQIDQERIRDILAMQANAVEASARAAEIPERYYPKTLHDFEFTNPSTGLALRAFRRMCAEIRSGRAASAIVTGGVGTGKTHLACAALKEVCLAGRTGRYTTLAGLLRRVKSTWSKTADETEAAAISAFVDPDLLVIDEVGVQCGSDGANAHDLTLITEIIDQRSWRNRSTILISNLSVAELPAWIGERAFSRLSDSGIELKMVGPDYRRKGEANG